MNLLNKMVISVQESILNLTGKIQYWAALKRNVYHCKLVGEKQNNKDKYNTIILYRFIGKRDIFEIAIKDLLENRELLEKFHPTEAIKFGAIAMGDTLFREDPQAIKQRFDEIKKKMLESTKG